MNSTTPHLPARTVLGSILGVWVIYFALTTIRGELSGFGLEWEMLWRRGVVCLVGVAATVGMWLVLRLFDRRSLAIKVTVAALVSMPAALVIAQTNQWMFLPLQGQIEQKIGEERGISIRRDESGNLLVDVPRAPIERDVDEAEAAEPQTVEPATESVLISPAPTAMDRWRMTFDIALGRYFLLLAWAALYIAIQARAQALAAEREGERFRSAAKAAELRSLRYQVNPHFLFNTLNSLSALVMTGKADRAEQMIQTISRFYRHSLADDSTGDVTLADEIDLQEHYLEIEAVRFPERLRVKVDLPDELAHYKVPGMILQPLVENSVKYGVSASAKPVTVSIVAREEYGRLVLTVSDDGPGTPAGHGGGFGIGLANVRDRLEARFGNEATVTSGPALQGYETELRLPMVKHG
ncbi:histidine kinase [Qipengyuania sp. 6B39]|uniref:sensor histidine kinase n=1 Tax=Qipengyuania proteolytica TaxID=2867239 RepID=UPI001C8AEB6F|nr:histidine kinase [Qipengyuania proteolytica]MBX7494651.1 histidine kinase [Qipengyuania proteolytica]